MVCRRSLIAVLLVVTSIYPNLLHAAGLGVGNGASPIKIQYRDLVDDSIYGHSGRPASSILDRLALSTPEGIARWVVTRDLKAELEKLDAKLREAIEADDAVVAGELRQEMKRVESTLGDPTELAKEVKAYAKTNQTRLRRLARDAAAQVQKLAADVEPVCEPAAFVLNDALAQTDPKTLNDALIELATVYPTGRVEPGWADVIRTRRFVVYTDGGGYCRLFLPGKTAEEAWTSAYPVARHILRSLLKGDAQAEKLAVDVYAYENDIATTTFTLHPHKNSLSVTAQDLGTPAGRTPLDLSELSRFFGDGLTLEGCGVNDAGKLVLIGSTGSSAPTLEGYPIELSDLAVAYRASAYAGRGESFMSLDKSRDENFVNVNFGGRLHDTRMGWVAYRCDLRFKTLGDDVDAVSFEDLAHTISARIPDYVSQQRRLFADPAFRNVSKEGTRFWFYPDDFKVVTGTDGKSCWVTHPRFTAAAERQESFDAKGEPLDPETPPWTALTLTHFNKNYDRFAALFPEVAELDHAARLLAVAEWLYRANRDGKIALDLDELLTITLPLNPTPRRREQLQIRYAVKKQGIPAEYRAYCMSTPRGQLEFEQDNKIYREPDSEWEVYRMIGGGLDFSARDAVAKATKAEAAQQGILKKSLTSAEPFHAPDGKLLKPSSTFAGGPPIKPPPKTPITAAAPEPGPAGAVIRRFNAPSGDRIESVSIREGKAARTQQIASSAYFDDSAIHSVWVSEHGRPERFATNTSDGVVTFTLPKRDGVLIAEAVKERRGLSGDEADFLAAALTQKKRSPSEVWNFAPVDADLRALDLTPEGDALVYFRENGEDVLRAYKKNGPATVLRETRH